MRPLKVLLWHEDTRAPGEGGGAESLLRDITTALRSLGHQVAWLQGPGIEQAVEQFRPDIVQVQTIHNFIPDWTAEVRWLQEQRVPHIWAMMDYWPFCRPRMLLIDRDRSCPAVAGVCDNVCGGQRTDLLALVNGSPIAALNDYTADIYRRNGMRVDAVVELGVETSLFAPDPVQRDRKASIYTSSAWPEYPVKGMHVLSRALATTAHSANLIAHVSRERVAEALKRAHVYVFPSCYQETFGLGLCEAMASNCAVIASDVAGARAQVEDGETGLLVAPRDHATLRNAIEWLMFDEPFRERLGAAAREHVEREHSLEAMGRRWEDAYRAVLEGSNEWLQN